MNRVLCYLHDAAASRHRRARAVATAEQNRLNALVGDIAECFVPDLEDEVRLSFHLMLEIPSTGDIDGAAKHLATELLLIADNCLLAVDRLEGGAA